MNSLANAFTESIEQFLTQTTWLEWCGVFTGILCVWLAAKNNIWNWPVAIVSVVIYIFIFFETRLYADTGLQVYFLITNIYGWYFWSKRRTGPEHSRPVGMMRGKDIGFSVLAITVFTIILGFLLRKGTNAAFPYMDSFCTACSIVAQVFLARKVLQNWLIWIFVDVIYVGMYISKDLYATAIMYALYIYIALIGYLDWRKTYREQTN